MVNRESELDRCEPSARRTGPRRSAAVLSFFLFLLGAVSGLSGSAESKQRSLEEWRSLTSPEAALPQVYVKDNRLRFYFRSGTNVAGFSARWGHSRIPVSHYQVGSARLSSDPKLSGSPMGERGWREATVIGRAEWQGLRRGLLAEMTPRIPGHGIYYQGLPDKRLLFCDHDGQPRSVGIEQPPVGITIDRHCSIEETLEILARQLDKELSASHPGDSLFVLLNPGSMQVPQPILLDGGRRQCIWLTPSALYDVADRGLTFSVTEEGFRALFLESHGLALLKNPVSSLARLGDLGVQTVVRFVRLPFPKPGSDPPPVSGSGGMDLGKWEAWLDRYTGTRAQQGSLQPLIDGERFFPRLRQAFAAATNHIHIDTYVFDKDDVGVEFADQLKERSAQVEVKVILDRMGSIGAGTVPPSTPLPEDFTPPNSIVAYLKENSRVRVRPFLNPWFSTDHSKIYLVDGTHAWIGGMNLGREYRYEWHDLMVELTGPVVNSLENEFRRSWAHEGPLGDLAYLGASLTPAKSPPVNAPSEGSWIPIRLLPTKTAWKPFSTAVQGAVRQAKKYIYVENPYLFDKRVVLGLVRARNRGVDVRVVLPRDNDSKAGGSSNLVLANYFLEHGVRVYFYPGMTHVKALLVDGWACLGSSNLNHLSLRVCQEHNVATSDPGFSQQLKKELFEEDFAHSFELTKPITVGLSEVLANLMMEGF